MRHTWECTSFCVSPSCLHPKCRRFSWVPEFALKRIILGNFPTGNLDREVADSVDFMVEQVSRLSRFTDPFSF